VLESLISSEAGNGAIAQKAAYPAIILIPRFREHGAYRERCGRVVGKTGDDSPAARVLLIWFGISMGGMIGVALPFVIAYAAIITWRDWPYRSHWALLVITGLGFAVSFAGLASPRDLPDWQQRFVWTAAPVLAIVGLLDHRLLMRAMRTEALPDTEHADAI